MTETSQINTERSSQSRFVDILAKISIVVAAYLIIDGIMNLNFISTFKTSSEYRIAEQFMPSAIVSPTVTIIEIILQGVGIIASIAMLKRLNWGRVLYISVLALISLSGIISSLRLHLSMSKYLDAFGLGSSLTMLIVWYLITIGINGFIIWKLTTKDILKEFV